MRIIGIVGRVYYNRDNQEIIQLNDCLRKVLAEYDDVVPIMLLPTNVDGYLDKEMGNDKIDETDKEKLDYLLSKCDGFVVPGGTYWYKFDEYVISYAIKSNKPLLAICAGFQCLCSMFALERDKFDMTKRFSNDNHYGNPTKYIHDISVMKDTLLDRILNEDKIMINSVHHDYVDFEMDKLKISAVSSDNVIEAVEVENHPFLLGVQWHPEYLLDDNSKKILDSFIENVKKTHNDNC